MKTKAKSDTLKNKYKLKIFQRFGRGPVGRTVRIYTRMIFPSVLNINLKFVKCYKAIKNINIHCKFYRNANTISELMVHYA